MNRSPSRSSARWPPLRAPRSRRLSEWSGLEPESWIELGAATEPCHSKPCDSDLFAAAGVFESALKTGGEVQATCGVGWARKKVLLQLLPCAGVDVGGSVEVY